MQPRWDDFVRSFRRIGDVNRIRLIKVHHLRHTVGSLLHTYEGTETIQTLIVGRDITGASAFA